MAKTWVTSSICKECGNYFPGGVCGHCQLEYVRGRIQIAKEFVLAFDPLARFLPPGSGITHKQHWVRFSDGRIIKSPARMIAYEEAAEYVRTKMMEAFVPSQERW